MGNTRITLKGAQQESTILVGDCSTELAALIQEAALIVLDEKIRPLLQAQFTPAQERIVALSGGEAIKSLQVAETLYGECFDRELQKSSLIVGIGGGTLCDLVSFVASTYLRGTRQALVPTTLLAQVDASIGGKNGVNFRRTKNLVGTIRQPELCICDTQFLETLPAPLIAEGYAEIIKHALIASKTLYAHLEERAPLTAILEEAILVKRDIVEQDEAETGERRKLNFGHTIGHAIEAVEQIPHGHAVAIGMCAELQLSVNRSLISAESVEQIRNLIGSYGLPVSTKSRPEALRPYLHRDKKRSANDYSVAVLTGIGSSQLINVTEEELLSTLESL